MKKTITLFHPHMSVKVIKPLSRVLMGRWIGQGPKVKELEAKFKNKYRLPYVISVNNCTAALHLSLILAGVKDKDEVITTPMTCSATNIPILYQRARAVFADIQPRTLNIDPGSVKEKITGRTKAIMVTHWAGYPCDMKEIIDIAKKRHIPVIEDAAHALGASYHGRPIGGIGDYTCFSFQAIKQITCGDGGILTVKTKDDYKRGKLLRWYGIDREFKGDIFWKYQIKEAGYKYHMNDIAAAILIIQLDEIDRVSRKREMISRIYREELRDVPGLTMLDDRPDRKSAHWLFTVLVDDRTGFIRKLKAKGIESHMVHVRCDIYPIFEGRRLDLPAMNEVESKYVSIPLHTRLSGADVAKIVKTVKSGW